jgi:hypothetical protein
VNVLRSQQEWLQSAYRILRDEYFRTFDDGKWTGGYSIPPAEEVIFIYGFPAVGRGRAKRIGECHYTASEGKAHVVIIHPAQWTKPVDVLHVLLHEMVHIEVGAGEGHAGQFTRRVREVGLAGKPTATYPGATLDDKLRWLWINRLPDFPAAAWDFSSTGRKKQRTRLRLWECDCDPPIKLRAAKDDLNVICGDCEQPFHKVTPSADEQDTSDAPGVEDEPVNDD